MQGGLSGTLRILSPFVWCAWFMQVSASLKFPHSPGAQSRIWVRPFSITEVRHLDDVVSQQIYWWILILYGGKPRKRAEVGEGLHQHLMECGTSQCRHTSEGLQGEDDRICQKVATGRQSGNLA